VEDDGPNEKWAGGGEALLLLLMPMPAFLMHMRRPILLVPVDRLVPVLAGLPPRPLMARRDDRMADDGLPPNLM